MFSGIVSSGLCFLANVYEAYLVRQVIHHGNIRHGEIIATIVEADCVGYGLIHVNPRDPPFGDSGNALGQIQGMTFCNNIKPSCRWCRLAAVDRRGIGNDCTGLHIPVHFYG